MTTSQTRPLTFTLAEALRSALRGEVIDRSDARYDEARRVWNGLIDRHPEVIARCADAADVVETIKIAGAYRPVVSIRGGGHQVAGSAVCDDGLVVDLSAMKGVYVDPAHRTVRAQPGATWGEVDRMTQLFGLATPGGEVSMTGVAGFTLGGGMGVLQRAYGLACDNLRSIEIVTADGAVRTASREEHPDLFWAARGGGRGLGVVTSFEFMAYPVGPRIARAMVFYPYAEAATILRAWRDLVPSMPEAVSPEFALWNVPADLEIPEERVVIVAGAHVGPPGETTSPVEAAAVLAPLAKLGTPLADASGIVEYVEAQRALDEAFPPGGRYFFKSHFMRDFSDEAIDRLIERDRARTNPQALIVVRTLGGAIGRVGADESAFPHRDARFNVSFDASWSDPSQDASAVAWARSSWDALRPFATGGVYVNFAGLDGEADREAVYGRGAERLNRIRETYDPDGLFAVAARRP